MVSANVKRHRFSAKVKRFGRRLDASWPVMFPRRRPAIALWILAFGFLAVQLQVWEGPPEGPEFVLTEEDRCLEAMAKVAVTRSLGVIGHGVKISSVSVGPMDSLGIAEYNRRVTAVRFSADYSFEAEQVMHTAAHESVHAIFDQADLNPWSPSPAWDSRLLIEEVTAEVLGAHIAGKVWALKGGNGDELTRRLVREYRNTCDWSAPDSIRRRIWVAASRMGVDALDGDVLMSFAIHSGSVEMIDAIDQICRENYDPWEAAHVVAERYIEPIDEPGLPTPQTSTAASGSGG